MRKETRCSSCIYHGDIAAGGITYCDYLYLTGHRRPCPGWEACTVYKPIECRQRRQRRQRPLTRRRDDSYGHK